MSKPVIAVLQGDGVGPELTGQALETLAVIKKTLNLDCESEVFPCGGEYYKSHGEEWSSAAKDFCVNKADAILFGSVGVPGIELPNGDLAGLGVLFFLRQGLDLYANLRPVQLLTPLPGSPYLPDQVQLHLVREATEGLYCRIGGMLNRGPQSDLAIDIRTITVKGTERIARFAFQLAENLARNGDTRPVTCIDKSNVLQGCRVFRPAVRSVAEQFPRIKLKFAYVDNFALEVLRNPQDYGVCVTSNAFGDILADLLAYHEGGVGMGATANYGENKAMFEALAGAQFALKGKGIANPVAIHRCLAMLLAWLGEKRNHAGFTAASEQLLSAITAVMQAGHMRTPDLGGTSTTVQVCEAIRQQFLANVLVKGKGTTS